MANLLTNRNATQKNTKSISISFFGYFNGAVPDANRNTRHFVRDDDNHRGDTEKVGRTRRKREWNGWCDTEVNMPALHFIAAE